MERNHKFTGGAVTEFDDLFEVAYTSMVKSLVQSTQLLHQKMLSNPEVDERDVTRETESILFDCIEMVTESMSILWLNHSKTLRLSIMEKVGDSKSWAKLKEFIQKYGTGLFTQQFLQLNNARAILHQGAESWMDDVRSSPSAVDLRLFDELDKAIPASRAADYLSCLLYTSPSPRDQRGSRMPSSA